MSLYICSVKTKFMSVSEYKIVIQRIHELLHETVLQEETAKELEALLDSVDEFQLEKYRLN